MIKNDIVKSGIQYQCKLYKRDSSTNTDKYWNIYLYDNDDIKVEWGRRGSKPTTKMLRNLGKTQYQSPLTEFMVRVDKKLKDNYKKLKDNYRDFSPLEKLGQPEKLNQLVEKEYEQTPTNRIEQTKKRRFFFD